MSTTRRIVSLRHGRRVDLDSGLIREADGSTSTLTTTEARLLSALVDRAGELVTGEQLLQTVWGRSWDGDPDAMGVVRNAMFKLRRKLERDPRHPEQLTTEQGDGYRLLLDERPANAEAGAAVGRSALIAAVVEHTATQPVPLILLGPWRSGKTTVVRAALRLLAQRSLNIARLDPRTLDRRTLLDPDRLLAVLTDELLDAVGIDPDTIEARGGTPHQRLKRLMERHVLPAAEAGLVLVVEDVDRLARVPEQADVLAMLRGWTEETHPVWERFRLVLTSATPPVLLTARLHLSPFNLGRTLHVDDLTEPEVLSLASARGVPEPAAKQVFEAVGGHVGMVVSALDALQAGASDPFSALRSELAERVAAVPGGQAAWTALIAESATPAEPALSELLRLGLLDASRHPLRASRPMTERLFG